jgi:hypothetical protein
VIRDRLKACRTIWCNFISGYRLGRAEAKEEVAFADLERARSRYDEARATRSLAELERLRTLVESGLSYRDACAKLDMAPTSVGELLADRELCDAVGDVFRSWAKESFGDEARKGTKA